VLNDVDSQMAEDWIMIQPLSQWNCVHTQNKR